MTEPIQGFQDPKLTHIFTSLVTLNPTTLPPSDTSLATLNTTTLPPSDYSHSKLPVGAIAGITVGSFFLVLLITAFLILRKRRRRTAPPQPIPELAATLFNPQELQACEIHEFPHGNREDTELPSDPIGRDISVPGNDEANSLVGLQ